MSRVLNIFVPKANHTYVIDTSLLPIESDDYATEYGYRQCLVDPTAGVKRQDFKSDEEFWAAARAKADKRMEQLESGNVPGSRTPRASPARVQLAAALARIAELEAQIAEAGTVMEKVA